MRKLLTPLVIAAVTGAAACNKDASREQKIRTNITATTAHVAERCKNLFVDRDSVFKSEARSPNSEMEFSWTVQRGSLGREESCKVIHVQGQMHGNFYRAAYQGRGKSLAIWADDSHASASSRTNGEFDFDSLVTGECANLSDTCDLNLIKSTALRLRKLFEIGQEKVTD